MIPTSVPGICFQVVTEQDYPFLQTLYASTRSEEMALATEWTDEQKTAFLMMQWQAQLTHYAENFPQATHHLIVENEIPIGRLYVDRRADEIRLLDIALLPQYRGHGLGTKLIKALLQEGQETNLPVRLYVWQDNHGAQRLYKRLGFVDKELFGIYVFMEWLPA